MSRAFSLKTFMLFHLITIIGRSIGEHQPLVFNPYTLEIYDLEDKLESSTGNYRLPYGATCSGDYEAKTEFDKRYSLDNKSLHLEYFFNEGDRIIQLNCDKAFELAIVYHFEQGVNFIEFGYEVYYDKIEFKRNFKSVSYSDFRKVKRAGFSVKKIFKFLKRSKPPTIARLIYNPESKGKKVFTIHHPVGLIWLSKVQLLYEHSTWTVKTASYKINKRAYKHRAECTNYTLGSQLYPKPVNLDHFYSNENQKSVFDVFTIPESSGDDCKLRHQCVKKYSMSPSHNFRTDDSSPLVCSNLTTIPIWYDTTEKLLNYLDTFLSVIAERADDKLYVTSGTHNILTLPAKAKGNPQAIHLFAAEKKIPIPKLIYKIVTYKTYLCQNMKPECWHGIVFVIHNEPEFIENNRVCSTDYCEELGWESIQYASADKRGNKKSTHVYCCFLDEKTKNRIGYKKDITLHGVLSLKKFPNLYYDETKDRQTEFEDRMKELFKETEEKNM